MRSRKGFTLIELLVVIAIIGLLAAIVLAALSGTRTRGNDTALQEQLSQIGTQLEVYGSSVGSYGPTYTSAPCPSSGTTVFNVNTQVKGMINHVASSNGASFMKCATGGSNAAAADSWAIATPLSTGTSAPYWCADSAGKRQLSYVHKSFFMTVAELFVTPVFANVGLGPDIGGGTGVAAVCP